MSNAHGTNAGNAPPKGGHASANAEPAMSAGQVRRQGEGTDDHGRASGEGTGAGRAIDDVAADRDGGADIPRSKQHGREDETAATGRQGDAAGDAGHSTGAAADEAGLDREVGDLDDPDAVEDAGALPGRAGGGLAGG